MTPAPLPDRSRRSRAAARRRSAALGALAALAALAAPCGPAQAQDDARTLRLRALAATCAHCHGTDGRPLVADGMSRLAGADAGWLAQQMRDFRDGRRPATVMPQIAKGYSDAQIDALAGYFAAQR